jgi:hypothetical protein
LLSSLTLHSLISLSSSVDVAYNISLLASSPTRIAAPSPPLPLSSLLAVAPSHSKDGSIEIEDVFAFLWLYKIILYHENFKWIN